MKILIVDDHPIYVDGLKSLLQRRINGVLILVASDVERALEILESRKLDLVLIDFKIPGLDGMDFLKALSERSIVPLVAMISSEESPEIAKKAMDYGALGFLPKSLDVGELLVAIQLILQGKQYLPQSMKARVNQITNKEVNCADDKSAHDVKAVENGYGFTRRQRDVLELIAKGYTNKRISNVLNISVNTTKEHVHNIFQLLNVNTRGQCAAKVQTLGLINTRYAQAITK